jgi:signal transduction histidine kinase
VEKKMPIYEEITPYFDKTLDPDEWEDLATFVLRTRPNTDIAVLRNDFMVIYSSFDDFIPGEPADKNNIMRLITAENFRYGYGFESAGWIRGETVFILVRLDREAQYPQTPVNFLLTTFIIISGFVALFALAMSLFIAKSITRSVLFLEAATRRLAAGELDVAVDIKGSNEITSLTGSLNRMRIALKEEDNRRSRFIMGITHDLKTPLALIKGYAEAIEDGLTGDPA